MSCHLASLSRLLDAVVAALGFAAHAAAHPMDPLNADEILAAANILLQGRTAQPGAIFQSIELREPAKAEVLAFAAAARRIDRRPSSSARTSAATRRPST
jgi:Cu2+-containing amine oxidase